MLLLASRILDDGTKLLIKDGILSDTLELTDKGSRLLLTLIFEDYAAELAKVAKEQLQDRENEKVSKVEIVNAPKEK